jgi:hypothetical protein
VALTPALVPLLVTTVGLGTPAHTLGLPVDVALCQLPDLLAVRENRPRRFGRNGLGNGGRLCSGENLKAEEGGGGSDTLLSKEAPLDRNPR